jgi:hypothetical protein
MFCNLIIHRAPEGLLKESEAQSFSGETIIRLVGENTVVQTPKKPEESAPPPKTDERFKNFWINWNWAKARVISASKTTSHKQLEESICSLEDYVERLKLENEFGQPPPTKSQLGGNNQTKKGGKQLPAPNGDAKTVFAGKAFALVSKELGDAKAAKNNWEIQQGWSHFYEAELLTYHLMDDRDWKARAKSIFNEAEEVLHPHEKKTVRDLIGKAGAGGAWVVQDEDKLDLKKVMNARRTVQCHYCDAYTKLSMSLKQLRIFSAIAMAVAAIIIVSLVIVPNTTAVILNVGNSSATSAAAVNVSFNSTATDAAGKSIFTDYTFTSFFFLGVALFGALGGTTSGMITIAKSSKGDVPERLLNSWLSIAKPVFGAVAALAISVFMLAGLLQSIEGLFKPSAAVTTYAIFAISFASGFSERIFLRVVGGEAKTEKG